MIATSALKAMLSSSGSSGTNEAAPRSGPTSQSVNPPLAGGTRAERRCDGEQHERRARDHHDGERGARRALAVGQASAQARERLGSRARRASVGSRTAAPELAGVTVFMSATR